MRDVIDTPWCPCQEERFAVQYPDFEPDDMPYVDGIDRLERVKSSYYYERKRKEARKEASDFSFGVGPSTPTTRRGRRIIEENFPDADFVCPCCEQEYKETIKITKVE